MNLRKAAVILLLVLIAFVATAMARDISDELNHLLRRVFRADVSPWYLNFFTFAIGAMLCSFLMWKFQISKWVIVLIVITVVATSLIRSRNAFYDYQQHPDPEMSRYIPKCEIESNYATYWEFLQKGCHLSVAGLTRTMIYRSVFWTGIILLSGWLFQRKRKRKKRLDDTVLDD